MTKKFFSFKDFLKSYIIVFAFCGMVAMLIGFTLNDVPFMLIGIYLQIWVAIMVILLICPKERLIE